MAIIRLRLRPDSQIIIRLRPDKKNVIQYIRNYYASNLKWMDRSFAVMDSQFQG